MKIKCQKCETTQDASAEDIFNDYSGLGYDAKLYVCPLCKSINIIEYIEDENLDVNNDERYFLYRRKLNEF